MPKVAYLDLDGVLVDFMRGALKFHNKTIFYPDIKWDFPDDLGLTPQQFWGPLDLNFWVGLEWTPEGKEILALVESYFGDNIAIVTSPPKTGGACEGKLAWVAREMPKYKRRCFVGARKELLAAPSKILIDDRDENLAAFSAARGFIAPIGRPWNAYSAAEPVILSTLEADIKLFLRQD